MVKNKKNLEYLQKLQTSLGFGEKLNAVLESAISRELPKFTLGISNVHRPLESKDLNAPKTDYIQYGLNFNRQKDGDLFRNFEVRWMMVILTPISRREAAISKPSKPPPTITTCA